MATETTPTEQVSSAISEQASDNLTNTSKSALFAQKAYDALTSIVKSTEVAFAGLGSSIKSQLDILEANNTMSDRGVLALSLLSNAVIGTKKSFDSLFRTENLNSFSSQIGSVIDNIIAGNENAIMSVDQLAGMFGKVIPADIKTKGAAEIKKFILSLAEGADNALRLQTGLIQMAGATGRISEFMASAGNNSDAMFNNMNNLLTAHTALISDTAQTANISQPAVEKFYSELGKVPGALQSVVSASGAGVESMSMLSAALLYAVGSGRSNEDVIKDLSVAYKTMGIEGEKALEFSSRMSQLSKKFSLEIGDVQDALRGATENLRQFGGESMKNGKIMEGSVKMMNNYIQALKNTGISGQSAINIVKEMHLKISSLDVAQRAFLSSQSGGPGGLRGAFQIEKMIRSGNIDEVMNMVQKTMQKQFGKIVTTDEAASSEQAASRAVLQRKMLTEGPLKLAGDEQSAARLLEAFSQRAQGKISSEDLQSELQGTMDRGLKFQQLSATNTGRTAQAVEKLASLASVGTLTLSQNIQGARRGSTAFDDNRTEAELIRERQLREANLRAADRTGQMGIAIKHTAEGGSASIDALQSTTAKQMAATVTEGKQVLLEIPNTLKGVGNLAKRLVTNSDIEAVKEERERSKERILAARNEMKSAPKTKARELAVNLQKEEAQYKELNAFVNFAENRKTENKIPEKERMQKDIERNTDKSNQPTAETTENTRASTDTGTKTIDVHVTGYCLACSKPIKESEHKHIVTR